MQYFVSLKTDLGYHELFIYPALSRILRLLKSHNMKELSVEAYHDSGSSNYVYKKHWWRNKSINEYFGFVQIQTNKDAEKKVNDKLQITRKVLRKDSSLLKPFVDMVNKDFDTNVGEEHFKHAELDYPPKLSEEVFNYKKTINET